MYRARVEADGARVLTRDEHRLVGELVSLYRAGRFPMADVATGRIFVHDPDPRGVIPIVDEDLAHGARGAPLGGLRVTRSLRQRVRAAPFRITTDTDFAGVVDACADPSREGAWISGGLRACYLLLHRAGVAHSVEAWLDTGAGWSLVGGLFGIHIRGLFAGEAMFSHPSRGGRDASKIALAHLVGLLRSIGCVLLDTQVVTPHMASMGAVEIPRALYLRRLRRALSVDASWPESGAVPAPPIG